MNRGEIDNSAMKLVAVSLSVNLYNLNKQMDGGGTVNVCSSSFLPTVLK
jgi:hypothetical protein